MTIDYSQQGRRVLDFAARVAPEWLCKDRWTHHHAAYLLAGVDPGLGSPFPPTMDDGHAADAFARALVRPDEWHEWSSRAGMWRTPAEWLERARQAGIPIPAPLAQVLPPPPPVMSGTWARQEAEILRALACLGHDPQALKMDRPGCSGVRAEVRDYLETHSAENWKGTRFGKAWERLLDNKGEKGIRYATDSPPAP